MRLKHTLTDLSMTAERINALQIVAPLNRKFKGNGRLPWQGRSSVR
jgi:hypothetical protein